MSGMVEGFDELLARSALRAGIRLGCAVPDRGDGAYWRGAHGLTGTNRRDEFDRIGAVAWRSTYVMEDVHGTAGLHLGAKYANFVRNDVMAAHADECLVRDPTTPGARQCPTVFRAAGGPFGIRSA